LAAVRASTGPRSINPATGKPYNLDFPVVTIGDMVEAQRHLIDALGIDRLLCVTGGSMGGMQALEWAIRYPSRVASAIPIATSCSLSAQGIASMRSGAAPSLRTAGGRAAIKAPIRMRFRRQVWPSRACSPTSPTSANKPCRPSLAEDCAPKIAMGYDFSIDFEVESYLHHQGESFVRRFDANSYLYISKAMDYSISIDNTDRWNKHLLQCKPVFCFFHLHPTGSFRRRVQTKSPRLC
jgi:homoserine O-acetyltransferase